ncbi:AMP-dependent synthetase/ligase [Calidifontibacter indicus]|uniref:AMP-dependent synthetase/ligase n=1 Tax=Calidifontibacter indicus TaxID=419650 RepID=UPI003D73C86A
MGQGTTIREFATEQNFTLDSDGILARLPWRRAAERPLHTSFERFENGQWLPVTAERHLAEVKAAAKGFIAAGIEPGDRVAIMACTRYEWILLDAAIWAAGGVTVPIYPSSAPAQVEWIVQNSAAKLLIVEDEVAQDNLANADIAGAEVLVIDAGAVGALRRRGIVAGVDDDAVEARLDTLTLDSPASLIYTSGTTGRPKGCVLTHANLLAEAQAVLAMPIGQQAARFGKRTLMFLPLAHVLARAITYAAYEGGATVGFWADFKTIVDKFASFEPDMILCVPRVLEKVHAGVRAQALAGGPAKAKIFRRAEQVAIEWSKAQGGDGLGDATKPGLRLQAEHRLFDKLVYGKVRAAMGGRCTMAISGGGALGATLGHFFRGIGLPTYEGYGLTETTSAITVNSPGAQRIGTVGRPIPGNAVRIADNGEIELKGAVVCAGYWQNEQATSEAFDDGWFRTGDLGALDADGYLTITGRAKEILVTAGGKNVAPGPMEEQLRAHEVIGNAVVVGEGRPFVGALITLDPEGAADWAKANNRPVDGLATDEQLRAEIQVAVDEASSQVSHAEGIKKFVVLPDDFTEETGELTPTLKVKRHVVNEKYADQIDSIYRK